MNFVIELAIDITTITDDVFRSKITIQLTVKNQIVHINMYVQIIQSNIFPYINIKNLALKRKNVRCY